MTKEQELDKLTKDINKLVRNTKKLTITDVLGALEQNKLWFYENLSSIHKDSVRGEAD